MNTKAKFGLALLFVPVIFLPSCGLLDCLKGKKDAAKVDGKVVVSMGGQAVITTESFKQEFDQLIEENPHLKSVLALMPDAKENFLKGMVNQEVVNKWVVDSKIDQSESYKKDKARMYCSVDRMLNTKYFGLEHPVQVTEVELTEFYDKNKNVMPDLMISRGGVKAVGVSFDKEADAKAFVAKVKETKDITKAAQAANVSKNLRDFKVVNDQSLGMDAELRDKVAALDKVPTVEVMQASDKSFWVVSATAKEDVKYRPFEQVKAGLEQYVSKEKRMELFDKEISKLKVDYNVVVNEEALKPEMPKEESSVALNEEVEAAQAESTQVAAVEPQPEATQVA
ncbi:MAG: peptidylprolyl isomerase [Candidatus Dependentiae bacterium]|nr:peptidylprolyl isomerase [Candidatus Dependentiae bacterium]